MHVVILGGGFCGATVAKLLDAVEGLETTLITKTSFFEYNPSAHKCLNDPSYQGYIRVPYNAFLKNTHILIDGVTSIHSDRVVTSSKEISFDFLVIATGVDYPIYLKNTKNVFKMTCSQDALKIHKSLKGASSVLIVGGGYIGTEISAEIACKMKDCQVTLVHSPKRLLERSSVIASRYAEYFLRKRHVQILFGEKVIDHKKDVFLTNTKRSIRSDVTIWCTGTRSNPFFIDDLKGDNLSKDQRIKVNDYFQLPGHPHIYAGGDITNIVEEKTARKAEIHARFIARNILCQYNKKRCRRYESRSSPLVISLGDLYGITQFNKMVFAGFGHGLFKEIIEWWTLQQFHK
ncbi:MAG: FAD-dependent oxidoreductase [Candidatus Thermoplasmatota archaeon]|nr:FAD-dependent oxidoreductase [Candidatus Thermoplasmatota archaeon]